MRVIGITGGIGSGKSALLDRLADLYSCEVISADAVGHFLCEPGQLCHRALVDRLGQSILAADGGIDREKVAALIFADGALRDVVNAIIHPAVEDYIVASIAAGREKGGLDFIFVEAALFIESGYDKIVDELWYVYADEGLRIKRVMAERGYSREKAAAIVASQLSDREFREGCGVVIANEGELDGAVRQAEERLGSKVVKE